MKTCLIIGAGGFIGINLSKYLINKGYNVYGISSKKNKYIDLPFTKYIIGDLRNIDFVRNSIPDNVDELYQLASITYSSNNGEIESAILMSSEIEINLNILKVSVEKKIKTIFFASSYSVYSSSEPKSGKWNEKSVYPAEPDTEHGWRKLICERIYNSYKKQYNLNIKIGRFHTIYGPYGDYEGISQKSINSLCKKVYLAKDTIDVIGDGTNERQFLYINDWIKGVELLMSSNYSEPINISSNKSYSINDIINVICIIANKKIKINYIHGNQTAKKKLGDISNLKYLGWNENYTIEEGIQQTYKWVIQILI